MKPHLIHNNNNNNNNNNNKNKRANKELVGGTGTAVNNVNSGCRCKKLCSPEHLQFTGWGSLV